MDNLNEVFNMVPVEVVLPDGKSVHVVEPGDEEEDLIYSRARHYELSEVGSDALTIAMKILRESESPSAVKEIAGLIKALSETNKNLLSLHKDKYDARTAKGSSKSQTPTVGQAVQTQNNIIFQGSSKELNNFLKQDTTTKS
jgi:hypothetical protein